MSLHPAARAAAQKLVGSHPMFRTLENLGARWRDEHEYEDIKEYGAVLAKKLPKGVEYLRMSKRPFGPVVKLPNHDTAVLLFIKAKGRGSHRACLALQAATGSVESKLGAITLDEAKKLAPEFVESTAKGGFKNIDQFIIRDDNAVKWRRGQLAVVKDGFGRSPKYKLVKISSIKYNQPPEGEPVIRVMDGKQSWRVDLIAVLAK